MLMVAVSSRLYITDLLGSCCRVLVFLALSLFLRLGDQNRSIVEHVYKAAC